jgi:hypothetical protein
MLSITIRYIMMNVIMLNVGMMSVTMLSIVMLSAGNTRRGGRLSTVDLLIRATCFVKKINIFQYRNALIQTSY